MPPEHYLSRKTRRSVEHRQDFPPQFPAEGELSAYPRSASRLIPAEVPSPYRDDFSEACKVLADSPKASAALSRRCLQAILRDKAATKAKDLADQIDEVVAS